jgi:hypothetical protein
MTPGAQDEVSELLFLENITGLQSRKGSSCKAKAQARVVDESASRSGRQSMCLGVAQELRHRPLKTGSTKIGCGSRAFDLSSCTQSRSSLLLARSDRGVVRLWRPTADILQANRNPYFGMLVRDGQGGLHTRVFASVQSTAHANSCACKECPCRLC